MLRYGPMGVPYVESTDKPVDFPEHSRLLAERIGNAFSAWPLTVDLTTTAIDGTQRGAGGLSLAASADYARVIIPSGMALVTIAAGDVGDVLIQWRKHVNATTLASTGWTNLGVWRWGATSGTASLNAKPATLPVNEHAEFRVATQRYSGTGTSSLVAAAGYSFLSCVVLPSLLPT